MHTGPITTIEAMNKPLKWSPKPLSQAALERFRSLLELAVQVGKLSESEAATGLRILQLNPRAHLARTGQRQTLLEASVKEVESYDSRLRTLADALTEEIDKVTQLIECQPEWAPEEESEEEGEQEEETDNEAEEE